jgi:hypothetical protein
VEGWLQGAGGVVRIQSALAGSGDRGLAMDDLADDVLHLEQTRSTFLYLPLLTDLGEYTSPASCLIGVMI